MFASHKISRGGVIAIPEIASFSANTSGPGIALSINKPTGTVSGDLLLAITACETSITWTNGTDSGNFIEVVDQGTAPSIRVAYSIAGEAEPASYRFNSNTPSQRYSGAILRIPAGAFSANGAFGTSSTASVSAPAVSLATPALLIAIFASGSGSRTFLAPSGMELVVADIDATAPSLSIFQQDVAAGSTGTRTSTLNGSGANSGILIGIKKA